MSSSSTSTRQPLQSLPLSLFTTSGSGSGSFPSPSSLPSKRAAAPSPKSSIQDLHSTVKRPRTKEVTPRQREILAKDELGVGKSPARRLFDAPSPSASTSGSGGLRGVTICLEEEVGSTSRSSPRNIPNRTLAPSPPIESPRSRPVSTTASSSASRSSSNVPDEQSMTAPSASIHDPGFIVHFDDNVESGNTSTNPDITPAIQSIPAQSTQNNPSLALDAPWHLPSSPSSSIASGTNMEDQENVLPPIMGTPTSKPVQARGRSKLIEMLYGEGVESDEDEALEEDLTPGRTDADVKGKGKGKARERASDGKERLRREVDRI